MFSSSRGPAVSVYPDSDKIGVWPGDDGNDLVFKRGTAVPWSEGEEGFDEARADGASGGVGISPAPNPSHE